ncbi:MAG: hypothetical protein CVU69_08640 [Deltaproteobacteria bacterium HGW-Deltaproteobacteria-4]|nr:MAG: hypothetical protein CVU69_08640 [Deltaproteobacteria bacterium HGW-Deltaproteobacteria-4]
MTRISLRVALLFIVLQLFTTLPTTAADTKAPGMIAPQSQHSDPAPVVNGITQATVSAGVLACASRVNQVANFLTSGSQGVGAILFTPPAAPDQELVSVSLEIPMGDGPSAYASASFAPNQVNGCGSLYETVVFWPATCAEVADKNFGAFKKIGLLSKTVHMLDGGQLVKIFLMPAGDGCVSIKKEIVQ